MTFYAGIGSRETPNSICGNMTRLASFLALEGYTLRSGNAVGADQAFHAGAKSGDGASAIFLPFVSYNTNTTYGRKDRVLGAPSKEAYVIAQQHHPTWWHLSAWAKTMHARNAHIVLGHDLDSPVRFVVCWTPKGRVTGGTGQALRMAEHYDIPVFNLGLLSLEYVINRIKESS